MPITIFCFAVAATIFFFAILEHREHLKIVLVNPACPVKMNVKNQAPKIIFWFAGSIFLATGVIRVLEITSALGILLVIAACLIVALATVNICARISLSIIGKNDDA